MNRKIVQEGKFIKKEKPATVVSAYYEMPSKYKLEDYRNWISLFLKSVPMYLIFFTESKTYDFIKECRVGYEERTQIVVLERSEWVANTYEQSVWDSLHNMDPERELKPTRCYGCRKSFTIVRKVGTFTDAQICTQPNCILTTNLRIIESWRPI
jgi:hypothetical protein